MQSQVGQPGQQHPDRWREDLNPKATIGSTGGSDERTAYDDKDLHERLKQFRDDELRQIPIVPIGSRLEQGTTYIDLSEQRPREFTATGEIVAGDRQRYVAKSAVDFTLWNRLIGVNQAERL